MMRRVRNFLIGLLGFTAIGFLQPVYAVGTIKSGGSPGCEIIAAPNGNPDVPSLGCLSQIVVNVIDVAFLFAGFAALVFLIFGAIKFIVSRGDSKGLQSAQKTMTFAVLGIIIIILAYTLVGIFTNTLGLPDIRQNFTLYQP